MVKMAISDYEGFEISDYEIKKQGYSYTYETLTDLKEDDIEFYFIAGGDSLMDIEKWRNTKGVLENCNFVVFNRGEYSENELNKQKLYLEEKYAAKIILLNIMNIDISSTEIRKRIEEGKRIDFFLPKNVIEYINENNLYKGD